MLKRTFMSRSIRRIMREGIMSVGQGITAIIMIITSGVIGALILSFTRLFMFRHHVICGHPERSFMKRRLCGPRRSMLCPPV